MKRVSLLYTNIGRGHPFYLDGILQANSALPNSALELGCDDVFAISSGMANLGWKLARVLYRRGASPGLVSRVFAAIRTGQDLNRPSRMLLMMGSDIRAKYGESDNPLLVAHPILVAILKDRANLVYQHGELVAPRESIVRGASRVFVPTEEVASLFREAGYSHDQVIVTGLCVESVLAEKAQSAFVARIKRYEESQSLTGAFYSSGAEPTDHVNCLVRSALSVVQSGGKALVFAKSGGKLAHKASEEFARSGVTLKKVTISSNINISDGEAVLIQYSGRAEQDGLSDRYFSQFDYLVAPPHERSNWALGLGIPIFIPGPAIGPFAPLNRKLLVNAGVGTDIDGNESADSLGPRIDQYRREGRLKLMACSGWGKYDINGFPKIVDFLRNRFA